ncbi:MAG TPA: PadR family transcriptional regulator [Acidimicrobiales bacterium]|nr:PadR family transcriptional regulator [Acidimicrobiales bacterium]
MATRSKRSFFRHGELHLVVLALLAGEPMHGYQLMGELARLFGPAYRPSPGSVYPGIEALTEAGLIAGSDDGGRRVFALTPAGSEALARRLDELLSIEARTGVRLTGAADVEAALDRFVARVRAVAPRLDPATLDEALEAAAARIVQFATASDIPQQSTTTRRIS